MIVTHNQQNFYINMIRRRQLAPQLVLHKAQGEYAFGISPDHKKIVFTMATLEGVAIYATVNDQKPELLANLTTEIQRKHYRIPEQVDYAFANVDLGGLPLHFDPDQDVR
jgi:hypothetical protein